MTGCTCRSCSADEENRAARRGMRVLINLFEEDWGEWEWRYPEVVLAAREYEEAQRRAQYPNSS